MLQQLNNNRNDDHIYVLWAHRTYDSNGIKSSYCEYNPETEAHVYPEALGFTLVHGDVALPIIGVLKAAGTTDYSSRKSMSLTLAHEVAHCLQMDDVYDTENHIVGDSSFDCLMDAFYDPGYWFFYDDILDGVIPPFCDSCQNQIEVMSMITQAAEHL